MSGLLEKRGVFGVGFLVFCLLSCGLYPFLGRDFFPSVDAGQIRLHLRAPTGTRIEETARLADDVEAAIRQLIPKDQLETILDNLGVPNSGINLSYSNAGTIGTLDGEIQLSLKEGHRPTEEFVSLLRAELPKRFPGIEFFFQPADIVTQILNFGLPAAIDVQLTGNDLHGNAAVAADLVKRIKQIPGAVDAHVHQRLDAPAVNLQMDRTRLQQMGLSAQNVGQNVLVSLSGSSQTAPAFWLNPANGVVYSIAVQAPQYRVDSLDALLNVPVAGTGGAATSTAAASTQLLGNLVEATSARQPAVVSRYNITPAIDVYVGVQGTDLASVASRVQTLVDEARPKLPKGSQIVVRGQVQTMQSSFIGLGVGLAMAIVLVYLLIVVNFQSWIDAVIIVAALPAALAGIAWMLFISGTTLSVPALTGAIMTMGVATANSILLVSFARQRQQEGAAPALAALEAGSTRIRPVLMTALAMIIGMIPMALGIGEGAEQNAPLGRAVIGGLLFATVSTLLFVPVVFAGVHDRLARHRAASRRARRRRAGTDVAERRVMAEHPVPPPADPAPPVDAAQRARVARGTRIAVIVVLVLLVVGAGRTIVGRMANAKILEANVSEGAVQYVKTTVARTSEGGQTLALPGSLQGFQQAPLAARSAGYVKRWTKDIGSHVAKGELLAVIESPEIDQQLSQAEAVRGQTAASLGAREEHGRALGGAAQEGRRLAAGARRAAQRPDPGDRQPRRRRGQRAAAAPAAGLHPHHGALRRRHHQTQRRRRRPHRFERQDAVRADADGSAARLRQRAAVVRAARPAGAEGRHHPVRAARPVVRRRGGAHVGVDRSGDADDAGRDRACRTRTASCCPAPTSRSSCRWPAAARSSCRPTCCSFAARARASPPSTRRAGSA